MAESTGAGLSSDAPARDQGGSAAGVGSGGGGGGPEPRFVKMRRALSTCFGSLGAALARRPALALPFVLLGMALCVGLGRVRFEDRVNKLWVETGGRLDSELDYVEQFNGTAPGSASMDQVLITVSHDGVLNEAVLKEHLLLLRRVYSKLKVDLAPPYTHPNCAHLSDDVDYVTTNRYSMTHICDRVAAPDDYSFFTEVLPCTRVTPLDCFAEGNYDASDYETVLTSLDLDAFPLGVLDPDQLDNFREDFGLWRYEQHCKSNPSVSIETCDDCSAGPNDCVGRPTFEGKSDAEIRAIVQSGCNGWAENLDAMRWPTSLIVGGLQYGGADGAQIEKAQALESVLRVSGTTNILTWNPSFTEKQACELQNRWIDKLPEFVFAINDERLGGTGIEHFVLSSNSFDNFLAQFQDANPALIVVSYLLMVVYAALSLFSFGQPLYSRVGLGLVGICIVALAVCSAFGLAGFLGVAFNPTSTQVLPFLALGLGVDDMFVLAHHFKASEARQDFSGSFVYEQEVVRDCVGKAGPSITLTSVVNFFVFFVGSLTPIPAVTAFCLQSCCAVLMNYVLLLGIFPAVMAADARRTKAGRVDLLCCITAKQQPGDLSPTTDNQGAETAPVEVEKQQEAGVEEGGEPQAAKRRSTTAGKCWPMLKKWYLPVLATSTGQYGILALKLCMVVVASFGVSTLESGLDISDVIPTGTYQGDFLNARFAYFDFFDIKIVTKDADYAAPGTQRLLLDMHAELTALRNKDGGSYVVQPPPAFWLAEFIEWVRAGETAIPPRAHRLNDDGLVAAGDFYDYLYSWLELDSITVATIQGENFNYTCSSVVTETFTVSGPTPCAVGARGELTYAFMSLYLDGLDTTDDFTEMITSVRTVCDKYVNAGVPNFPTGQPFTFWEQYVNIWNHLLVNIGNALGVVFVLSFALFMSPVAAGLVTVTILITVLEIAGLMGLIGVKLSAIPVVSLIMSVGIAVEFTVHLVLAYLDSVNAKSSNLVHAQPDAKPERHNGNDKQQKRERRRSGVEAALLLMFSPILDGGLSTILGVLMLAFSEYGFVRKYFFAVFFGVVGFGLLNGLVLLPVLLQLVGPLPRDVGIQNLRPETVRLNPP